MKRLKELFSRTPRVVMERGPAGAKWARMGTYAAYGAAVIAVLGGAISLCGAISPAEETPPQVIVQAPPTTAPQPPRYGAPPAFWDWCVYQFFTAPLGEEGDLSEVLPTDCWGEGPGKRTVIPPRAPRAEVERIGWNDPRVTGWEKPRREVWRICYLVRRGGEMSRYAVNLQAPEGGSFTLRTLSVIYPESGSGCEMRPSGVEGWDEIPEGLEGIQTTGRDFLDWCYSGREELRRNATTGFDEESCPGSGVLDLAGATMEIYNPSEVTDRATIRYSYLLGGEVEVKRLELNRVEGRWEVAEMEDELI